jgi:hypothetical protein
VVGQACTYYMFQISSRLLICKYTCPPSAHFAPLMGRASPQCGVRQRSMHRRIWTRAGRQTPCDSKEGISVDTVVQVADD